MVGPSFSFGGKAIFWVRVELVKSTVKGLGNFRLVSPNGTCIVRVPDMSVFRNKLRVVPIMVPAMNSSIRRMTQRS